MEGYRVRARRVPWRSRVVGKGDFAQGEDRGDVQGEEWGGVAVHSDASEGGVVGVEGRGGRQRRTPEAKGGNLGLYLTGAVDLLKRHSGMVWHPGQFAGLLRGKDARRSGN